MISNMIIFFNAVKFFKTEWKSSCVNFNQDLLGASKTIQNEKEKKMVEKIENIIIKCRKKMLSTQHWHLNKFVSMIK